MSCFLPKQLGNAALQHLALLSLLLFRRSLEAEPTQGAWRVRRGLFARVPMGGCGTLCFACLLGQSQLRAKGWVSVLPRSGKAEEWEKVYVLLHPWEVTGGDG